MFKRMVLAIVAVTALAAGTASAETQVYYGFHIGITNAPSPPKIVYREVPDVVVVPGSKVYVVENSEYDCDVFRVGSYWYVMNDGYWYRAQSHRGPFMVVDVRRVPRAIFSVPSKHWKHHPHGGPPGLAKGGRGRGNSHKQGKGPFASSD